MKATALLIAAVSAKAGMSADDFSQVGEAFEQPQPRIAPDARQVEHIPTVGVG